MGIGWLMKAIEQDSNVNEMIAKKSNISCCAELLKGKSIGKTITHIMISFLPLENLNSSGRKEIGEGKAFNTIGCL